MVSETIKIVNEQGMHMRPASVLSQKMTPFASTVTIHFNNNTYNAKSVMALMSACLKYGSEFTIEASGPDEEEALKAAVEIINSGLGD